MTNTEKLLVKGCSFPKWVNSEEMITSVITLAGDELYSEFGFTDATSTTKFLNRYFPGKPKYVRFNNYVKELLV